MLPCTRNIPRSMLLAGFFKLHDDFQAACVQAGRRCSKVQNCQKSRSNYATTNSRLSRLSLSNFLHSLLVFKLFFLLRSQNSSLLPPTTTGERESKRTRRTLLLSTNSFARWNFNFSARCYRQSLLTPTSTGEILFPVVCFVSLQFSLSLCCPTKYFFPNSRTFRSSFFFFQLFAPPHNRVEFNALRIIDFNGSYKKDNKFYHFDRKKRKASAQKRAEREGEKAQTWIIEWLIFSSNYMFNNNEWI